MITVSKLSKHFGPTRAVKEVSFSIKPGEIVGFLGPNGAGKTTTMRLLLGLLRPTQGNVSLMKHDPLRKRMDILPHIGYLPENNPLYGEMKVREYLDFVGAVKKIGTKEMIQQVAESVNIEDKLNEKIDDLSRGYRQRVGLAAALLGGPDILILDEPTSGLDPLEQDKIKELIRKVAKKKIVIFSTHILSEVQDIANRLIIINHGSVVYDGKKPVKKGGVEKLFKSLVS